MKNKEPNLPDVWNNSETNDLPDGIMWLDPFSKGNPKIMKNGRWEEISDEDMDWGKE